MFWDCHVPSEAQTVYYKYYKAALIEFIRSNRIPGRSSDRRSFNSKPLDIIDLVFRLLPADFRWVKSLISLQYLYEQIPKTTWYINCEFRFLINPYSPVIFELLIRTINAHELLNTTVNYNGITINDIIDVVRLYVTRASTSAETVRRLIAYYKRIFQNNYIGIKCYGMSVTQIR
jgi:hypothetical protein